MVHATDSKKGGLAATDKTPWLGVHAMTEFMFCPRAGLIAYERNREDSDDEDAFNIEKPSLQYAPCYDLVNIESALKRTIQDAKIRIPIYFVCIITILLPILWIFWEKPVFIMLYWIFIPFIGVILIFLEKIWSLFNKISTLKSRREAALNAMPKEPNHETTDGDPVYWWSILAAGFESIPYRDNLVDEQWHVIGRPWRVLRKGSLRIPVWRRKSDSATNPLKIQHYARIGAYFRLIEKSEGIKPPYGVVLLANQAYEGITVRNGPGAGSAFHKGLRKARKIIEAHRDTGQSPATLNPSACSGCPYGKPYVYKPGETDKRPNRLKLPAYVKLAIDEREYHSECGDRFMWVPPHAKAIDKKLF